MVCQGTKEQNRYAVARTVQLFSSEMPMVGSRGFFAVGGVGSQISRPPKRRHEETSNKFSAPGRRVSSVLREAVSGAREMPQTVMVVLWLRGISEEVLERNGIMMEMRGQGNKCIAFPYTVNGEIVNVKYRNVRRKDFHQVRHPAISLLSPKSLLSPGVGRPQSFLWIG